MSLDQTAETRHQVRKILISCRTNRVPYLTPPLPVTLMPPCFHDKPVIFRGHRAFEIPRNIPNTSQSLIRKRTPVGPLQTGPHPTFRLRPLPQTCPPAPASQPPSHPIDRTRSHSPPHHHALIHAQLHYQFHLERILPAWKHPVSPPHAVSSAPSSAQL